MNNNGELFELLELQLQACQELRMVMEEKQRIILNSDIAALDEMIMRESRQINEITLRADKIEETVEADNDECCRLMRGKIKASYIDLKKMNDVNRNLLKDQLALTRSLLEVVVGAQSAHAYDSNGNKNNRKSQMVRIFDQMI